MIKIFIKTFLIILLITGYSNSSNIKNIEVIGNKIISNDTIIVLSGLKNQNDFNNISLNEALKKLYDSTFFKDVNFVKENEKLLIQVVENPIIENIEISGIKKQSFLDLIKETISSKKESLILKLILKNVNLINNM